jgi:hypothetical protein
MAQKTKRVRRAKGRVKRGTPVAAKEATTVTRAPAAVKAPKVPKAPKPAATGVRAKAARHSAEGKFSKVIFNQIGGKECRRLLFVWPIRSHGNAIASAHRR